MQAPPPEQAELPEQHEAAAASPLPQDNCWLFFLSLGVVAVLVQAVAVVTRVYDGTEGAAADEAMWGMLALCAHLILAVLAAAAGAQAARAQDVG